ncbi:IS110 family transposase [Maribacter antarcticus]|uniref:IS110 family transposase n=1 Tax=Maribacter antarcticus TaxID=505250 RepID=UPI00047D021D|nr:IS110 family transposase [Maribacter antarcticus]
MNKYNETFGVDLSKDVFDVHGSTVGHDQYKNDESGFRKFLKALPDTSLVVMEATGYYHYRLAQFLYKNGITVSVVNPLSVKRFIQMKLAKVKTDKSDARAICKYAVIIEEKLLSLVKQDQQHQLTVLTSIPGIGIRTALFLIVCTDGFKKFETVSQLCSYVGITPTIRESGSSVRGRSRISKIGNRKLRNLLFLCSFNACKHNKACKGVYERIVNKGERKKLALIAVSIKLLKRSFTIAKSGKPYNETYVSVLRVK